MTVLGVDTLNCGRVCLGGPEKDATKLDHFVCPDDKEEIIEMMEFGAFRDLEPDYCYDWEEDDWLLC